MTTIELLTGLKTMEERPWPSLYGRGIGPHDLARLLRPYGVKSGTIRIGLGVFKGYLRAGLEDPWDRYLPAVS